MPNRQNLIINEDFSFQADAIYVPSPLVSLNNHLQLLVNSQNPTCGLSLKLRLPTLVLNSSTVHH